MEIDKNRFYIFDCNGKMIGNPFGYKTHRAAMAQTNRKGASIHIQIWRAFFAARAVNPDHKLIHSVKAGGAFV